MYGGAVYNGADLSLIFYGTIGLLLLYVVIKRLDREICFLLFLLPKETLECNFFLLLSNTHNYFFIINFRNPIYATQNQQSKSTPAPLTYRSIKLLSLSLALSSRLLTGSSTPQDAAPSAIGPIRGQNRKASSSPPRLVRAHSSRPGDRVTKKCTAAFDTRLCSCETRIRWKYLGEVLLFLSEPREYEIFVISGWKGG